MLRAGTFKLMFHRVSLLLAVIFLWRRTRSYKTARRPAYWFLICLARSGWVTMSNSTQYFQWSRTPQRRLSPQLRGSSRWRWVRTQGGLPGLTDRRACGSRAVRNRVVCGIGCRRQPRSQRLQFRSHPYFQPRRGSGWHCCHPIGQCPGTGNYSFPGQFSRGPGSNEERRSRLCLRPHCPRSWSSFSSRLRGRCSLRLSGWRRSMSARLWKPAARSQARRRRERRGLGTEPAAVGSGRCWMCW